MAAPTNDFKLGVFVLLVAGLGVGGLVAIGALRYDTEMVSGVGR